MTVSVKRVQHFLSSSELDSQQIERASAAPPTDDGARDAVVVEAGEFAWDKDEDESTLININMQVGGTVAHVTSFS